MDSASIEKEALSLSEGQRAVLADRLLESISSVSRELKEAWVQEADSRMEAFRQGEIASLDGPSALAELRSRFRNDVSDFIPSAH